MKGKTMKTEIKTYRMEVVSAEWGGTLRAGWRPAIDGALNNTNKGADEASTFASLSDALAFLPIVWEQHPEMIRIIDSDGNAKYEETL